jgi:hypothetical protein
MNWENTSRSLGVHGDACDRAADRLAEAGDKLYKVAIGISEEHWAAINLAADEREEFFQYAVRVRRRTHGVTIEWMKSISIKVAGERRLAYRSVTRGSGVRYRRGSFLAAAPWEMAIIMEAEAGFGKVRDASALLSQSGRRLGWIKKAMARGGDDIEPKRVREVLRGARDACEAVADLVGAE